MIPTIDSICVQCGETIQTKPTWHPLCSECWGYLMEETE